MAEKESFFSRFFGNKKKESCCCQLKITKNPESSSSFYGLNKAENKEKKSRKG